MRACLRARLEMIFSTRKLKEEMGAHLEGRLEMLLGPSLSLAAGAERMIEPGRPASDYLIMPSDRIAANS